MNILRSTSKIALWNAILRRDIILPAVFGIALLFPPQFLHAQIQMRKGNQIAICNSGNTRLSVARVTSACSFGYTSTRNVRWFAEGWYYVEPGECENLLRSEDGLFGAENCSGYYYFAFSIIGKNGKGMMRYKADPGTDFFGIKNLMNGMKNTDESFCVKTADGFGREGKRSSMDDCPNGWELVPFSIGMSVPWNGGKFKLTINADRSSDVELFTPPKSPDEKTAAAEKKLDELLSGKGGAPPRKYLRQGALTINADGLMTVITTFDDGIYVTKIPLNKLDPAESETWVAIRSKDQYVRLKCRDRNCMEYVFKGECDLELTKLMGPDCHSTVSSVNMWFSTEDDAENWLREIKALIQHYSK